jgi:hypothetical protein
MAREQMLTAIPAFPASESWAGAGAGARGVSVTGGKGGMVLDGVLDRALEGVALG